MWKELKIKKVDAIDKFNSEFVVWMGEILPYGSMKVRIYEEQNGHFFGVTVVQVKRKFDGDFEAAIGHGSTPDEALEDTLRYFNEIVEHDYPNLDELGLKEDEIQYVDWSEF